MKKNMILMGLFVALTLLVLLPARASAAEAEWVRDPDGAWWLYDEVSEEAPEEETGWCEIDGRYYHYLTGWQQAGGKWYYMDPDTGRMWRDQMLDDNGKRYYLSMSGAMLTSGWVQYQHINMDVWSYAGKGGALVTGWQKIAEKWYYFEPEGQKMYIMKADEFLYENGKRYYFSKSGVMQTGWIKREQTVLGYTTVDWYYGDKNGVLASGWKYISGAWYWFGDGGPMYSDGLMEIDGKYYKFDKTGAMTDETTFWHDYDEGRRIYIENRVIASGWKQISGKWYYFDGRLENLMATTARVTEGTLYDFDENGGYRAVTGSGWHQLDDEWFYVANGKAVTGWKKIGASWYYFQTDGENDVLHTEEVTGSMYGDEARTVDGKLYLFGSSGALANKSGWHKLIRNGNTRWYYTDASGVCAEGWKKIGSTWYYFEYELGYMYAGGTFWIEGKPYRFDDSGAWIPD